MNRTPLVVAGFLLTFIAGILFTFLCFKAGLLLALAGLVLGLLLGLLVSYPLWNTDRPVAPERRLYDTLKAEGRLAEL